MNSLIHAKFQTSIQDGSRKPSSTGGFSLLEILVSIVIFAIGLLALVQLQGSLTRSASDSNQRTVAVNLAEEVIEQQRGFARLSTDPNGVVPAFADIVSGQRQIQRGGIYYDIDSDVEDYYYSGGVATSTAPTGAAVPDFKLVTLTVSWGDDPEFRVDDETQATLGTGSIRLTDVISKTTTVGAGRALSGGDLALSGPEVQYDPGSRPDVISISLGNNRFKESTTPLPDVVRSEELVETTFDVVTYSQLNQDATFIRREEFRAVSCECTLKVPAGATQGGQRPTVWTGAEYDVGEFVSKPYGESASNQQSVMCDVCCRDHHDGGTGTEDDANDPGRGRFDPFKTSAEFWGTGTTLAGDHKHYNRNNTGSLVIADSDGDRYVEACRLIRKAGFFKVAQDLRAESINNFPASYVSASFGAGRYSTFVTSGVSAYEADVGVTNLYEQSPPTFVESTALDPAITFPASTTTTSANLPTALGGDDMQLQTRGVYVDYLSDELRVAINCLDLGGSGDACNVPGVGSALEIIPFFDVQLTWLSRWTETPNNNPVDVTNQAVESDNAHSRGMAQLGSGFGFSVVNSEIHKGNLGLTATDPIDPLFLSQLKERNSFILAIDATSPPPLSSIVVSGDITSAVGGVKASDIEIEATDAQCDRTTTGFECVIEADANTPRLKIFNYHKRNKLLVGCSEVLDIHGSENGANNWTRFNLPMASTSVAHIVIKENACN